MFISGAKSRSRPKEGLDELGAGRSSFNGSPETRAPQQLASQSSLETELELSHSFRLIYLHR